MPGMASLPFVGFMHFPRSLNVAPRESHLMKILFLLSCSVELSGYGLYTLPVFCDLWLMVMSRFSLWLES